MGNLVMLIGCMAAGALLRRLPAFPAEAHKGLNAFIVYLSLPALTLLYIPKLEISWTLAFPIAVSWLVFLLGLAFFLLIGKAFALDRRTVGCLVLCCGLGNTSFVGFPLIEQLYGQEGLKYAILVDQPGSFLALATVGMGAAAYFSTGKAKLSAIGLQVLRFPPFPAFVLSLTLVPFGGVPVWSEAFLKGLGGALTPLALVSIGLQLSVSKERLLSGGFALGLLYKLALAPAAIFALYAGVAGQSGLVVDVSVLEAAMAPMITASILAMDNDLDPPLAGALVGVGIPLSLGTVHLWHWLLQAV